MAGRTPRYEEGRASSDDRWRGQRAALPIVALAVVGVCAYLFRRTVAA
jgi:hypothetical protein